MILFVIDAQAGITSLDETIARILRQEGVEDRVIMVANKVDSEHWLPDAMEAGGVRVRRTALRLRGERLRRAATLRRAMAFAVEIGEPESDPEMQLAIVGRRNVGKSTLINTLCGEERVIVSEIAGTTRDAVDVRIEMDDRILRRDRHRGPAPAQEFRR